MKNSIRKLIKNPIIIIAIGVIIALVLFEVAVRILSCIDIGLLISIIALIIAIIAFYYAAKTYFSIDSVNSITSMEGNVLENECYSVAYSEMIHAYKECKNVNEFTQKLTDTVLLPLKKESHSCIEFADKIQRVIDNIIWFAYINRQTVPFDQITAAMQKELIKYGNLSNGIQYVLNESVKLIIYIFNYQLSKENDNETDKINNLADIRSNMLRNPISQITYFDYLGLYYMQEARAYIRKTLNIKDRNIFSIDAMQQIRENINKNDYLTEKKNVNILLKISIKCFSKVGLLIDNEPLWKGYWLYNYARALVLSYLVNGDIEIKKVLNAIDDAVIAREEICFLYSDDAGEFIGKKLEDELTLVKDLQSNFHELIRKMKV